jgi:hypothetical protein
LPAPTTLAPASGIAGATVTVNGTHLENVTSAYFTDTRGAQTVFADIVGTPTKTKLQVQVPREAATGPIDLLNAAGSSLTGKFTVKPYVSSLDPNQGVVGVAVEVDGGGFVPGSTTVKFGGVASTNVSAFFPSLLIATVPNGAHTGAVTVTTPYGTATGPSFKVLPTASAVSATAARVGSALTVSGTGLTDLRSVTFRGVDRPVRASYVRISSTQLRVVVPNGARTGAATVTTAGGSAQTPVITITG